MNETYAVPCPNCGKKAIRSHFISKEVDCPNQRVVSTSCSSCDYLIIMCSLDCRVLESSSPKFSVSQQPTKTVNQRFTAWHQTVSA